MEGFEEQYSSVACGIGASVKTKSGKMFTSRRKKVSKLKLMSYLEKTGFILYKLQD